MDENKSPLVELSSEECHARLRSQVLGRLVAWVGGVVDIFPVNFVMDQGDVVLRTAEGTKLAQLVIGDEVLFEVDQFDDAEAWSVVIRGSARVLDNEAEIAAAEALPLKPMVPTIKRNFVRITPNTITGRAFARVEEPRRDGPQDY
jgi:nitroimidazol reductase NimA-like FMN-containing flavoprotein (pyridoxamine 5'-phosphate oxidase superfamily)